MFLVVARTNLDEIPLAIVPSRNRAVLAAQAATEEDVRKIGRNVMGVDDAAIVCVAIIQFAAGIPVSCDIVRDWEEPEFALKEDAKPKKKARRK
jgi:hypothetical protein